MNPSRRHFIKQGASMAAAFPFILPSHIWSAPVQPNDRIRMGFIGMGKQNQGLLGHFMRLKDAEAVAVCDVDTNRRKHARQRVEKHYEA
ncbi:MAG: gfo/Idh/MocA family oxidoreductase, partial [Verrucomicrobiota bacterium]